MKIIFLAGAPGSGKSTHGTALTLKNPNIKHFSIGNIIRDTIKNPDHPITKEYSEVIKRSDLMPEEVIFKIVEDILKDEIDKDNIILLDGYPRVEKQYDMFKEKYGMPNAIIHLEAERDQLVTRMQDRAGRADNTEEIINKRLKFHKETTEYLIEKIKDEFINASKEAAIITVNTDDSFIMEDNNSLIYEKLKLVSGIGETLKIGLQSDQSKFNTINLSKFKLVNKFFDQQSNVNNQIHIQPSLFMNNGI